MTDFGENWRNYRYENGMQVAKRVSDKMSTRSLDPELARHLSLVDESVCRALEIVLPAKRDSSVKNDLKMLGFEEDHFDIKKVDIRVMIAELSKEIIRVRTRLAALSETLPSKKELDLLLRKDIPKKLVREKIIEILFSGDFLEEAILDVTDVAVANQEPVFDENTELHYGNVIEVGETFEEVAALKMAYGRDNETVYDNDAVVRDLTSHRISNQPEMHEDDYVFETRKRMENFIQSSFCFIVSRLAEMPENMLWIQGVKNEPVMPEMYQQKLDLLKNLSAEYKFFDFTELLVPALRAYMRVYLSIAKD